MLRNFEADSNLVCMAKHKILVVDDEESLCEILQFNLEVEGYEVDVAYSAEQALGMHPERYSLILLDVMMPKLSGFDVCRQIRNGNPTLPIIMLTAKGEEIDKVLGLELGADDYVTKPFSPKVLIARIKAVLRRAAEKEAEDEVVRRGPLTMNRLRREATLRGTPLVLTCSEFEILYLLAKHAGWVFTRNQIVNAVKGDDYPVTERSIDVQMVGIRKKLGTCGGMIETVRGVGYRFNTEL